MTDEEASAEYSAAKDEYEAAEAALARARHRLRVASDVMCRSWDQHVRAAEARAKELR